MAIVAACSDAGPPPQSSVMPDSVDQIAFGFAKHITEDGVERAYIEADSAYHFPQREAWEMFGLRVVFRSPTGTIRSELTSETGTYRWRTGNMEARGNVVAVTPDGRQLETCRIDFSSNEEEISGPCHFVYTARNETLTGDAFTADPDFRNVRAVRPSGTVAETERGT